MSRRSTGRSVRGGLRASAFRMRSASAGSRSRRFSRRKVRAAGACSMKTTSEAPREKASIPSAPLPAKASSTRAPGKGETSSVSRPDCRMLKRASRLRSEVGRTSRPCGTCSLRPRYLPATTRMSSSCAGRRPVRALQEGGAKLLAQDLRRNLFDGAFRKGSQLEGSIGHAHETVHLVAEVLADHPNFPVLALAQAEGEPRVAAHLVVEPCLYGAVGNAVDGDPLSQLGQRLFIDPAIDADSIASQPCRCGQLQAPLQPAIVGQQKEPFRVQVKAPDRHDPGEVMRKAVIDGRAALWVARSRQEPFRLVEAPEARGLSLC